MLYKYPYTDLYNLNLDWMIQAMKEMQAIVEPLDRVVNSVNNMTGDVVITKQFLLNILESMVSKFNGRAGDVTLTAADVNNTLIDITWTSDPGDVIGDIQQNVLDQMYAAGKRVMIFLNNLSVPDTIYFLTLVGDVVTPQIYSPTAALAGVASFNGQTGAVTATGSNLDTASDNDTPISESIGDLQSAIGQQSQQIDELPPVIVSVTVDAGGASMSATDQAKLTADMIMCWYKGNRSILDSDLSITPAAGSASVAGTARSSTSFTIAFIHSANGNNIASVIPRETGKLEFTNVLPCLIFKDNNTCIFQSTYNRISATIPSGSYTEIVTLPEGFTAKSNQFISVVITDYNGNFKTYALVTIQNNHISIQPQTTLEANTFNFFSFTYSTI